MGHVILLDISSPIKNVILSGISFSSGIVITHPAYHSIRNVITHQLCYPTIYLLVGMFSPTHLITYQVCHPIRHFISYQTCYHLPCMSSYKIYHVLLGKPLLEHLITYQAYHLIGHIFYYPTWYHIAGIYSPTRHIIRHCRTCHPLLGMSSSIHLITNKAYYPIKHVFFCAFYNLPSILSFAHLITYRVYHLQPIMSSSTYWITYQIWHPIGYVILSNISSYLASYHQLISSSTKHVIQPGLWSWFFEFLRAG